MRLHRIVPVLLYRNGAIVRSQAFKRHYTLGDPLQQMQRYLQWDVDEIMYLDISPSNTGIPSLLSTLPELSRECFAPLAAGGNIHTLMDIEAYLHAGADRVVLGSEALDHPDFVNQAAGRFGTQAIIVSVDYRIESGRAVIYAHNGTLASDKDITAWIQELRERGAGEVLLHSIDRDGMGGGYDLDLISQLSQKTAVPLIACGGANCYTQFVEAVVHGASATAASNIFGFKEVAYQYAKEAMIAADVMVRQSQFP